MSCNLAVYHSELFELCLELLPENMTEVAVWMTMAELSVCSTPYRPLVILTSVVMMKHFDHIQLVQNWLRYCVRGSVIDDDPRTVESPSVLRFHAGTGRSTAAYEGNSIQASARNSRQCIACPYRNHTSPQIGRKLSHSVHPGVEVVQCILLCRRNKVGSLIRLATNCRGRCRHTPKRLVTSVNIRFIRRLHGIDC
jgi:hypothetical protein